MPVAIAINKTEVADFCQRHQIQYLALFGSVLRGDFGPRSDVDVLVEFDPQHVPGFLRLHDIEQELSAMLGHPRVDLVTRKFLNRRIQQQVLDSAEVVYDQR